MGFVDIIAVVLWIVALGLYWLEHVPISLHRAPVEQEIHNEAVRQ